MNVMPDLVKQRVTEYSIANGREPESQNRALGTNVVDDLALLISPEMLDRLHDEDKDEA